jgi:CRISPR/Cas system-associated exonuclease Cas4 (RecB family)
MSQYYTARRVKNLYNPHAKEPFKLSRSKIDLYIKCPRCFYLDRRLGVGQPPGYPFNLNSAVDCLLKKEFDMHRAHKTPHPLMDTYGIDAVPFQHEKMEIWRENFKGIECVYEECNFTLGGAVDDIWQNSKGELIVVDYKATSKESEVSLDAEWQDGYKRQMEFYQWLLRKNGFKVSDTGYFVYANGMRDREAFDGRLEFEVKLISYTGNTDWVEKTLKKVKECLDGDQIPAAHPKCDYCAYVQAVNAVVEGIVE